MSIRWRNERILNLTLSGPGREESRECSFFLPIAMFLRLVSRLPLMCSVSSVAQRVGLRTSSTSRPRRWTAVPGFAPREFGNFGLGFVDEFVGMLGPDLSAC